MSDQYVVVLKEAAQLFREGQTKSATELIEQVQSLPSPDVVNVATSVLNELPQLAMAAADAGDASISVIANAVHEHYFACRVLRVALVRDWKASWQDQAGDVIDFVQKLMVDNSSILAMGCSTALLAELCLVHSIIWKLQWGVRGDEVLQGVAAALIGLLPCGTGANSTDMSIVGRILTCTTIEEFGLFNPAAQSRGLTIAEHESCRRGFQSTVLLPVAQAAVAAAALAVAGNPSENDKSCGAIVKLLYAVLSWRFNASMLSDLDSASMFADAVPDVLDASGPEWYEFVHRGVAVDGLGCKTLLDVLVEAFRAFSSVANAEMAQLAVQTIVQWCSFSGSDWSPQDRALYADSCLSALFSLTAEVVAEYSPERAPTLLSCCQGFNRLVCAVGCDQGLFAHPELERALFIPLLQLTQAVIGHTNDANDEFATESLDLLLRTWDELGRKGLDDVTVRCSIEDTIAPMLSEASATVVQVFVREKVRQSAELAANDEDETSHAQEYANSHTELIALLGRHQPALVGRFLNELVKPLMQELLDAAARRSSAKLQLNEALWYVVTVAAKFVGDTDDGEQPCIPREIVNLAQRLEAEYPENDRAQENANEVFQLTRTMMSFAAELQGPIAQGLVSPGIVQAVLLYFHRFAASYLFPNEDNHADFSPIFLVAFNSGEAAANAMLSLAANSLMHFGHDVDVLDAACNFLWALLRKPAELGEWLVNQEVFHFFVSAVAGESSALQLPGAHRGKLFGFVMSVCPLEQVDELVLQPIGRHLSASLRSASSSAACNIVDATSAIESITGAFGAIRTPSCCGAVLGSLSALVTDAVDLVSAHRTQKSFLNALLKLLHTIVTGCGSFLPSESFFNVVDTAQGLLEVVVAAMNDSQREIDQMRSVNNIAAANEEEDERVAVLTAAAELVLAIATWGLMDLCFDEDENGRADVVAKFAVRGVLTVINFSTAAVLDIPSLRDTLFQLVKEVSGTYTAEFMSVSPDEAQKFLDVVDYAVNSGIPEIVQSGYGVMEAIAAHCQRTGQSFDLLGEFVASIARTCATSSVPHRIAPSLCNALFALVGAHGVDPTLEAFHRAMSGNRLLAVPFDDLCRLLGSTDFHSHRPEAKRRFMTDLKCILAIIRGTMLL